MTARDVARAAGVSQPTVSQVLTGNPGARVAAETRARVLAAAESLGYRPNLLAQALKQRRSYALGVIIPDVRNPFYADVVTGVERVAAEGGYAVLLCETRETPVERHLEALRARWIDGVIIDATGAADLAPEAVGDTNVVLVGEPSERLPWVSSDVTAAGRLAAEHLLSLGHRELAFMGPASALYRFHMRERGFVRTLATAGVELRSEWLRRGPATAAGGLREMRALLGQAQRPSAVFCANDLMAVGALKACAQAGVMVPNEISIMGCDDIELAVLVTPELTTVHVPARESGARAARLLLSLLAGKRPPRGGAKLLRVRLVARGSTAAAR